MFNQGGAANNAKQGASVAAGGAGNRPSGGSTPPSSSVGQQAVQQQQQSHPYGYGAPHSGAQYGFPTPFNLVNAHPHQTHPLQHQTNPAVGGGNLNPAGGGGAAGNAASSLIDPMLSTLSDGGEGMSEDEENGASAGVKAGGTATGGGNNGINQHHLEDEDFHGDGSQGGQPGSVSLGVATAVDENGQPVKKKRRRQALSCTECKRRKIKCDRQNPCSPCTRRGEADRCRWATQEPIPDAISPFSTSEKFVTRQEYDMLHQKVLQLETIVAGLAPRAFLPGLDPLNLPMGPPPFPFGPPPHHGGPAPQHHPYPGPPGQQQPGGPQDGQFPPGAAGQAQAAQDIHQIYQTHLAYAAAAAAHNAQAQAAANAAAAAGQQQMDKAGDAQMEVDQATPAVQQHATGGTEHTAEGQGSPPTLPETTGKLIPASPSASSKAAKGKKRKDRPETEEAGEEGNVGRSGAAAAKGQRKPRSQKQAGWDTNGSPLLPQEQAPGDAGETATAAS